MKLFNKILCAIRIFVFLPITGQNTIAYLYFKINQNYIAKNICVQKDIKNNFCMGNCYLAAIQKRLNNNKKQQTDNTIPVKYNSSNTIQEYIVNGFYKLNKIEITGILKSEKRYNLLIKYYAPTTPPPQIIAIS